MINTIITRVCAILDRSCNYFLNAFLLKSFKLGKVSKIGYPQNRILSLKELRKRVTSRQYSDPYLSKVLCKNKSSVKFIFGKLILLPNGLLLFRCSLCVKFHRTSTIIVLLGHTVTELLVLLTSHS